MSIYKSENINIDGKLSSLLNTDKYTPALSNLYEIDVYAGALAATNSTGSSSMSIESGSGERFKYFASFHAVDITINGESITFERHPVTKTFYLGSGSVTQSPYTRADEISITWRESNDWFIKRYHEAWISMFYNKDSDTFKSVDGDSVSNLYRTFKIKLPYLTGNRNHLTLVAENVLPMSTGNMNLSWSNNPNLITHAMSYKVERLYWENAPDINSSNTTGTIS